MKKIGLIGGTFDPVHLGHISLALFSLRHYQLDQVIFIPTNISIYKNNIVSYFHRLNMLRLAIKKYRYFTVSQWEKNGDGYFSNTLNHLSKNHQFYFIFGSDIVSQINKWKNYQDILKVAQIILVDRDKLSPISSTQVRSNKKSGLAITNLVNPLVESYIFKNNLY